jgi:hypothetical protein
VLTESVDDVWRGPADEWSPLERRGVLGAYVAVSEGARETQVSEIHDPRER